MSATMIQDIEGTRNVFFETSETGSVFLSGPRGLCIEFDRSELLASMTELLGLVDPLETLI